MYVSNLIGVIADDLTGANDTALQFYLKGCNTQVLLNYEYYQGEICKSTQAWAMSVETRNKDVKTAYERTKLAALNLKENFNIEYFYKKIDSTLRGNIAVETMALLEVLKFDAAIIAPAFPNEGRITIGGYHLLKGIPLERTELARDPHFPIYESYIPGIIEKQLGETLKTTLATIDFKTITNGAGPILMEINRLISEGKKIIIADSVSSVDLDQIALAIQKTNYKILPCGSAGLARSLSNIWLPDVKYQHIKKQIPKLPKLIISGSATDLTSMQIQKLKDYEDEAVFISLKFNDILMCDVNDKIDRIYEHLQKNVSVIVYTSEITENEEEFSKLLLENNISKELFMHKITNYLSILSKNIIDKIEIILLLIGGESAFKCCEAINSESLNVIDQVAPAIPLCIDHKARLIVTKSGNLGNAQTLVDILKYFKQHEE